MTLDASDLVIEIDLRLQTNNFVETSTLYSFALRTDQNGIMPVVTDLTKLKHVLDSIMLIDRGLTRIGTAARDQLVKRFLASETPAQDLELISAALVSLIETGQWPDWQREFNDAVEIARIRNAS